ncbi:MAG: hypothetical protein Q9165_004100 [Trypethelium subeluteriae]
MRSTKRQKRKHSKRETNAPVHKRIKGLTSSKPTFLHLPREIRDMIYDYALDWNDAGSHLSAMMKTLRRFYDPKPHIRDILDNKGGFSDTEEELSDSDLDLEDEGGWISEKFQTESEDDEFEYHYGLGVRARKPKYPPRTTPHVLLLNRQITAEATAVLLQKPFRLHKVKTPTRCLGLEHEYTYCDYDYTRYGPEAPILNLITAETIRRMPRIEVFHESNPILMQSLKEFLHCVVYNHLGCECSRDRGYTIIKTHLTVTIDDEIAYYPDDDLSVVCVVSKSEGYWDRLVSMLDLEEQKNTGPLANGSQSRQSLGPRWNKCSDPDTAWQNAGVAAFVTVQGILENGSPASYTNCELI